jgi:hypothetical protein
VHFGIPSEKSANESQTLFGRIVLAEMVGFIQILFVNLPFCAGLFSLLEPLLTR